MNLRIYVYKIAFLEVPYYYYGVHKEKVFNEEYLGSPVTHKDYWKKYTPQKEILDVFDYSDEGWLEAQEKEINYIKPVSGPLTLYQKKKGIDISKRKKL